MKSVSVITINFNNAEGLQKTIDSVISQTFSDYEFIIVDGGSTDNSIDIIKKNVGKLTYWVSENDGGIYNAQNKGVRKATGEYCLFLNSGDYLMEADTLEKLFKNKLTEDIVYGNLIIEDNTGNRSEGISPGVLNNYHFMISTLWHPCTFIKRGLFERFGYYNEKYKITGDYEFFIRTILKNKVSYKHCAQFIAVFNTGGIGSSAEHKKLQEKEREQSWLDNFSPAAYKWFRFKTRLKRRLDTGK